MPGAAQHSGRMSLFESLQPVPKTWNNFPAGESWPFGASWVESEKAFNFALFSRYATDVTLVFYRQEDVVTPRVCLSAPSPDS